MSAYDRQPYEHADEWIWRLKRELQGRDEEIRKLWNENNSQARELTFLRRIFGYVNAWAWAGKLRPTRKFTKADHETWVRLVQGENPDKPPKPSDSP